MSPGGQRENFPVERIVPNIHLWVGGVKTKRLLGLKGGKR